MKKSISKVTLAFSVLLVAAGLVTYLPSSLSLDFVEWDDTYLIQSNPDIRAINLHTLKNVFTTFDPELYMPLTFVSYQMNYAIGGLNPSVYLVTNLLLHIVSALLLQRFIYLLFTSRIEKTKNERPKTNFLLFSWFAAFLFLLHPMHTEVISWASARKDALAMPFYIGSMIMYLRWQLQKEYDIENKKPETRNQKWFIWCLIFGLLAMLSKAMAITLPVTLLLIDEYRNRKYSLAWITEKKTMFILAFVIGLIALIGKQRVVGHYILTDKILIAFKGGFFALWRMFLPTKFAIMHPQIGEISFLQPDFYLPILALILAFTFVTLYRKRFTTLFFGFFFYFIALSPTFLGNSESYDVYITFDRYNYIPSIGIYTMLAVGAFTLHQLCIQRIGPKAKAMTPIISLIVCLLLMGKSIVQTKAWASNEALLLNVLQYYPTWYTAHDKLGNYYYFRYQETGQKLDLDTAYQYYQNAITQKPDSYRVLTNLGSYYAEIGDRTKELESLEKAVELEENYTPSQYNLARAYEDMGRLQDAAEHYEKVLTMEPNLSDVKLRTAAVQLSLGRYERSKELLIEILLDDPDNESAIIGLKKIAYEQQKAGVLDVNKW